MTARRILFGVAAVLSGAAVGALAAGAVSAIQGAVDTSSTNESNLVPQSDVNEAWASAVEGSTLTLPAGMSFPKSAPWIFNTEEAGDNTFYEAGLFDSVAAQYWRCSWLKAELAGDTQSLGEQSGEGTAAALAEKLGSEAGVEYKAYRNAIESAAAETGQSASAIEYEETCELLTGGDN